MFAALLLGCLDRAPQQAAVQPAPPVVVDHEPGCDTPDACATACDQGRAVACNRLGLWLQDGLAGAAVDPVAAAERYRQACELGAGIGCFNLAHQKSGAQGIPADPEGAATLLSRALLAYRASCDAGATVWCTNLAGLYQRGEGVPQDAPAAFALYSSTCVRGDPLACVEQAGMMERGEGTPVDLAGAAELLKTTCDTGSAEACNNLGITLEGHGEDPRPIFTDSCRRGVAIACRNLALRTEDPQAALELLVQACDDPSNLDGVSCAMAGDLLTASSGGESRAIGYFERACSVGVGPACLEVVHLGSLGFGAMTPEQALPLVQRGCMLGDVDACNVLKSLEAQTPAP